MNYYDMQPYMFRNWGMDRVEDELESMKEMYPTKVKYLSSYVEEELNKYEYFGSFIYDEYPDKVTVYGIVRRVFEKQKESRQFENSDEELVKMIIELLVYNEIFARKKRRGKFGFMV